MTKIDRTERRTALINIRVRPSLKDEIERLAAAEYRSLTNWIETLMIREVEKVVEPEEV